MISRDAFHSVNYIQRLNTCVLASYAVAACPFIKIPVLDLFVAYCSHFGLAQEHPEREYEADFRHRHPGYEVVWKLHHDSTVATFKTCRDAFRLDDVRTVDLTTVEHRLAAEKETTLMLFINKSKREQDLHLASMHSIAVGYSLNRKFFYYDTGIGKAVENIGSLADLGECGDRFFLVGRG